MRRSRVVRAREASARLAQVPTFVLHGDKDDNVPLSEAERMLEESAELVRQRQSAQRSARLDDGDAAEALVGCHADIREARDRVGLGHSGRTEVRVDVVRLTAEILDPRGNSLVRLERMVPTAIAEEAP